MEVGNVPVGALESSLAGKQALAADAQVLPLAGLTIKQMADVTIQPATFDREATLGFSVGAYARDGQHIDDFLLERNWGVSGRAAHQKTNGAPEKCPEGIYGGLLFPHYGHFLLESLSRVWALKAMCHDLPVIWHVLGKPELTSWQEEVFGLLDIDVARFVFVKKPVQMRSIYVPSPGYKIQLWADPHHAAALCVEDAKTVTPGKKVWLSRSLLDDNLAKITNEAELEKMLQDLGWLVIHPEQLSVAAQLDVIKDAEVLAGFEGSAFHTLLLVDYRGQVKIFERTARLNQNYMTIARAKGLRQQNFKVSLTAVSGDRPNKMKSEIKNLSEIMGLL